jgi:hypothetical protein
MKKVVLIILSILFAAPAVVQGSDRAVFLNAFGEAATAYLNDSFLLLGTTADSFVADVMQKDTALDIARKVQKRVRALRAKLKAVAGTRLAEPDKKLIGLLDQAYGCLDVQAWALYQYVENKNPETARRFDDQRTSCLDRLKKVAEFYSTLPPAPEVPEPLSTR